MASLAAETPSKLTETVSIKKRLLVWLGIYFGFQLPLVLLYPSILNFPSGLAPIFAFVAGAADESPFKGLAYLVYLVHLSLTLFLPGRRAFRILMVTLVIIVSLNTASCMRMTWPACFKGES